MVNQVLFSQAIERAFGVKGAFDVAVEVGPHPALKGPVTQIFKDISGQNIPYTGLLSRGKNDVEAFADGLGYLWTYLGESTVNLEAYDMLVSGCARPKLLKNLPAYQWDHGRVFWQESRLSKSFRTRA